MATDAEDIPENGILRHLVDAAVHGRTTVVEGFDVSAIVREALMDHGQPNVIVQHLQRIAHELQDEYTIAPAAPPLDPTGAGYARGMLVAVCHRNVALNNDGYVSHHEDVIMVIALPVVGRCQVVGPLPPSDTTVTASVAEQLGGSAARRAHTRLTRLTSPAAAILRMLRFKASDAAAFDAELSRAEAIIGDGIDHGVMQVVNAMRNRIPQLLPASGRNPASDGQALQLWLAMSHLAIAAEMIGMPFEILFEQAAALARLQRDTRTT
ncbi:MAG TPA: hypothetical protein VLA88_01435 [Candidatus Saccharimonadales bacterium]|nr:hypothetical protein [Candidatus Saccharimonadales bacterium]